MIYNGTMNDYGKVCNSCTVYISSADFYFHWHLKKDITGVKFSTNTQTTIY